MLTVALTPVKAVAASAPCAVVDIADMLAAGSLTTSGVLAATGGGGTAAGGICDARGTGASLQPSRGVCSLVCQAVTLARERLLTPRTLNSVKQDGR
jgi:hypothetical protein